jgi:hypothetical protein
VLAVDIDGDVRAYPVQILMWHEIVNDTVGGIPVAVTYCPLCNSALAYDRRIEGRTMEFGTRSAVELGAGDVRPPDRDPVESLHRAGHRRRAHRRRAGRVSGGNRAVGGVARRAPRGSGVEPGHRLRPRLQSVTAWWCSTGRPCRSGVPAAGRARARR